MTGFQETAAVLSTAGVGLRSIAHFHDFLMDLRAVPVDIETIRMEIRTLDHTLSALASLTRTNGNMLQCADRVGLPQALSRCGRACDRLLAELYNRMHCSDKHSILAKFQVPIRRKSIENVFIDVNFAKQTTILAVHVTQM
jgi:hypothetical protein